MAVIPTQSPQADRSIGGRSARAAPVRQDVSSHTFFGVDYDLTPGHPGLSRRPVPAAARRHHASAEDGRDGSVTDRDREGQQTRTNCRRRSLSRTSGTVTSCRPGSRSSGRCGWRSGARVSSGTGPTFPCASPGSVRAHLAVLLRRRGPQRGPPVLPPRGRREDSPACSSRSPTRRSPSRPARRSRSASATRGWRRGRRSSPMARTRRGQIRHEVAYQSAPDIVAAPDRISDDLLDGADGPARVPGPGRRDGQFRPSRPSSRRSRYQFVLKPVNGKPVPLKRGEGHGHGDAAVPAPAAVLHPRRWTDSTRQPEGRGPDPPAPDRGHGLGDD